MKRILSVVFIFVFAVSVQGQSMQKLKIETQKTGEGMYDFYVVNPNVMPFQIKVYFTELDNMSANCELPYCGSVEKGRYKLFSLHRDNLDIPGAFNYKYSTRMGAYPVVPDENVKYKIPVMNNVNVKMSQLNYSNSRTPDKIVLGFEMNEHDTVCCSRKGVVAMVTKTIMRGSMKVGDNAITLLHPDGTMSKYENLADSSMWVCIGDTVMVGDALGIVSSDKYPQNTMKFSVYFSSMRIDAIEQEKVRDYYTYILPVFR